MKPFFLILASLLILCTTTGAQESMMASVSASRLQDLLATARANYPRYKIVAARVRAAEAGVDRVKWSYFDVLNFNYLFSPTSNYSVNLESPNYFRGYQIGLFVNVGSILQKPSQVRIAKEEAKIAHFEEDVTELNLEAELKARYYRYVMQQSLLRTRTQAAVDADNMLRDIKYKYEKGERTFEAYNQILLTYSQQVAQKLATEADLLIAKSNLEELLGQPLEDVK